MVKTPRISDVSPTRDISPLNFLDGSIYITVFEAQYSKFPIFYKIKAKIVENPKTDYTFVTAEPIS